MKKHLRWLLPLVVVALGVAAAGLLVKYGKKVKPSPVAPLPPLVQVIPVQVEDHRFIVRSQGTVMPRTEIQLVPEVSGRVVWIAQSFAAGGFFNEGEALLKIEPRDFELAATNARARLAEARVRLQREEAESELARKEWKSLGQGDPSPLTLREPQLAEAQAAIASAEAALEQAERDLKRTVIRAPFDGRVSQETVDAGQVVTRGSPVARLYAVDHAEVRLPLSVDELAYLDLPSPLKGYEKSEPEPGPLVKLKGNYAGETHEWTGRVVRTEGEIDPRTRMAYVVARVEDPYARSAGGDRPPLAPGLFVKAEISGRLVKDVVVLPRTALRGKERVLIVDKEERLRWRPVEIARASREQVVVRSGLKSGERVCVSPVDVVVDGMKVRVAENEASQPQPKPAVSSTP